jgi:hypothetical protein
LLVLDSDSSDAGDGSEQEDGGELQLKQHHAAAAAAAAGDADESEAPAAAAAVDRSTAEQTTPTGAAADRLGATAGHKSSSSSSEDESPPMTLGRRTAPRVFRRPMQAFESDSSDGGDGSEQEDGSLSRAHGCCDTVAARRCVLWLLYQPLLFKLPFAVASTSTPALDEGSCVAVLGNLNELSFANAPAVVYPSFL